MRVRTIYPGYGSFSPIGLLLGTPFTWPKAMGTAMPALATGPDNSIVGPPALGNPGGGSGIFTNPTVINFDMTLTKVVPPGSEKRVLKFQAQAYNVFNHAELTY